MVIVVESIICFMHVSGAQSNAQLSVSKLDGDIHRKPHFTLFAG